MGKKSFFSLFILTTLSVANASWAGTCTVDATQTNQIIRGFGAASAWNAASNLSPYASTLWAVDNTNGHAGLSLLRTRIDPTDGGSGSAWNNEAGPMTLAKSVNPNITIWSTEWSPPATYKNNNSVDGGGSNGALNSTATFKGAASGTPNSADTGYASYLTRYIQYIQSKFGVSLYAVSCQNEPDWDPTYEAAIWNAGQFDVFTGAFHSALSSAGLSTKIMITESFGDRLALASTTMNDATNAPFVSIIAGHIYGGGPNPLSAGGFSHLTNQDNWETEISDVSGAGPDNSMTSGLTEAGWLYKSIVNAGMNAFHHWWIWGSDNSALITSSGVSKKLMVIGQYSKFVRPGYYRMGATTVPTGGVSVTAFKNTNTSSPQTIVIVAINGNNSTASQTFSLNGLNVTSVVPWVTDNNNNLVQMAAVAVSGNSFTYNLTGPSVTSFVGVNNVTGATNTFTPVPPTATFTKTNTPVPPTATFTFTATKTNTPVPPTATFTFTATRTNTPVPPTATFTFTATRTNTPVPPTATFTFTATKTNTPIPPTSTPSFTSTFTSVPPTATRTNTPVPPTSTNTPMPPTSTFTFTMTRTNTPVPPTSTFTALPPTATNTSMPPTATPTNTPVPPTVTNTPVPPTSTFTSVPPSSTPTNTPVPPTATNTPVLPTATPTNTLVPPTDTPTSTFTAMPPTSTFTSMPPTATRTNTPTNTATLTPTFTSVPPTATFSHTPVPPTNTSTSTFTPVPPTATHTPTPVVASSSFKVQLLSGVTGNTTNSPHPQIQVVNTGNGPLNLNGVTVKYWFNCDCTTQGLQAWVDWAGLMPLGSNETGNVHVSVQSTNLGGQTDYILYSFTGNVVLQPGQMLQVQSRFNKSDWSNMTQSNDWSFAPNTSFADASQVTGYLNGGLVWGMEPVSKPAALTVASAMVFPNPSTGNGATLSFNLNGSAIGANGSLLDAEHPLLLDPNAKITLSIYSLNWRLIWTQTLTGGAYGTTGEHQLYWNEKDIKGAGLSNGIYYLRVTVQSNGQTTSTIAKILILG